MGPRSALPDSGMAHTIARRPPAARNRSWSGSLGGFSNQLMGVKQTTDVLEKGTWVFAGIVAILCVVSPVFISSATGATSKNDELIKNAPATAPKTNQPTTAPLQAPASTTPKP